MATAQSDRWPGWGLGLYRGEVEESYEVLKELMNLEHAVIAETEKARERGVRRLHALNTALAVLEEAMKESE